jgi:hypothetical protein
MPALLVVGFAVGDPSVDQSRSRRLSGKWVVLFGHLLVRLMPESGERRIKGDRDSKELSRQINKKGNENDKKR